MGGQAGLPDLIWHETIDSTNEEARRLVAAGRSAPIWIAARLQSVGRGRAGRGWVSPAGNLYATLAMPNAGGIQSALKVPFAMGVAASRAVKAVSPGLPVQLKWPNDLRVNGAKLGGILVETAKSGAQDWVIAGIGINVASRPESLDQATTCLADHNVGFPLTADHVIEALMRTWDEADRLSQDRFDLVISQWLASAEGLGERFIARPGGQSVSGVFEGLEPDGALKLRLDDGRLQIIRAGDVQLVRKSD